MLSAPLSAATLRPVWQPNGPVEAMLLRSGTLYLAGSFSALSSPGGVSSVARSRLAAIDWASGNPVAWDPGADGTVYCLGVQGSTLYAGGSFTYIGGISATAIAALSFAGNTATAWAPGANGAVRSLESTGTNIFIGGDFSLVAGVTRNALAELNAASPTVTAYDAKLSGSALSVRALVITGSDLYVGGSFSEASGTARPGLASFSKNSGALNAWAPAFSFALAPSVYSLFVLGGSLWIGGDFVGSLGGAAVKHLTALSLSSGLSTWAPAGPNGAVQVVVPDATGRLHAGGLFSSADSVTRSRYATYFQSAPVLETVFSADLNAGTSDLRAILVNGSEVALAGSFNQVDGQAATNLAIVTLPALGAVPTATPTPAPASTASASESVAPYVYPQPGGCAGLFVAVPFPRAGKAHLRFLSVRGSVLGVQTVSATGPGERKVPLECSAWGPGLIWMESTLDLVDGSQRKFSATRFIVQAP